MRRSDVMWRAAPVIALAGLLNGCDLASAPTPMRMPTQTPTSDDPAPTLSSANLSVLSGRCEQDVRVSGAVVERTPGGTVAVADAVVGGRFPPATFEPAANQRTNATGRYEFCRWVPEVECGSGTCSVQFEIRASKEGYTPATTMVTVEYDAWSYNDFAAPDVELVRE